MLWWKGAPAPKRVLVYGDSLSWGWVPQATFIPAERFPPEGQWPRVMAVALGDGFEVVIDALPGRVTDRGDPLVPQLGGAGLDGLAYLPAALGAHAPLDLVVLMLGSNDLIGLRARATSERPFTVVEDLKREADARFLREEQDLNARIAEMQKQLSCLDTRSSDEVGRAISEERLPGASGTNRPVGESAALDAPKRRAERARPSPAGGMRRSVGASSSQSLAPVSGISPERKGAAGQTAGSGVGFKPVGRSSGDHPKVSVPNESVPSGSSFRAIPAAAASGAALTRPARHIDLSRPADDRAPARLRGSR